VGDWLNGSLVNWFRVYESWPTGGLSFACWQTWGYFTIFSKKNQAKLEIVARESALTD